MTLDSSRFEAPRIESQEDNSSLANQAASDLSREAFSQPIPQRSQPLDSSSSQSRESHSEVRERTDRSADSGNSIAFGDDPFEKYKERYKPIDKKDKTPQEEDRPDRPDKPDSPDDKKPDVKPDKPKPDDVKPDGQIKPRYETSQISEALELAAKNNLPVIVHVGASWCGPCRQMESGAWPAIEKDANLNSKAIYLHLDVDKARQLSGEAGAAAKELMRGVTGYPTIKAFSATTNDGKRPTLTPIDSRVGGLSADQLREFVEKNLKK